MIKNVCLNTLMANGELNTEIIVEMDRFTDKVTYLPLSNVEFNNSTETSLFRSIPANLNIITRGIAKENNLKKLSSSELANLLLDDMDIYKVKVNQNNNQNNNNGFFNILDFPKINSFSKQKDKLVFNHGISFDVSDNKEYFILNVSYSIVNNELELYELGNVIKLGIQNNKLVAIKSYNNSKSFVVNRLVNYFLADEGNLDVLANELKCLTYSFNKHYNIDISLLLSN